MDRAKVFMTGRSQAVRIPKAYRFDSDEVTIERTKDGVLLKPAPKLPLGERLWAALGPEPLPDFERPPQGELERDAAWWDAQGFKPVTKRPRSAKPGKARR